MEGSIVERSLKGAPRGPDIRPQGKYAWALKLARVFVGAAMAAGILAGAIVFYQYMISTRPATPARPSLERARPVESVVVSPATIRPNLQLFGQIVAGRSVDLRVLVAGEVREISPRLNEGGRVEAGEVLVSVDKFDYEGARVRAGVELAEAEARIAETRARLRLERDAKARADEQLQVAKREFERLSALEQRGVTTPVAVDASRSRLAAAQAVFESRSNQIPVLEAQLARETATMDRLQWNVSKAERDVENTRLLAPFSGILSNVAAEVGRLLNVSDRVATLTDLNRLEVRFTLTDAQFARLAQKPDLPQNNQTGLLGRPIELAWGPEEAALNATGRIDRVSPAITAATGGVDVIATIDPSGGLLTLRPGAFVRVITPDIGYDAVIRVPQSAIHPGDRVYVIGADNRLQPRAIEVAGYDREDVLVRGTFGAEERVLATRLPNAAPGMLVQLR